MNALKYTENIPCRGKYDVIVCGGGVAGVAASVSARRNGKSVLLLEKTNLLGGLSTIGLVNLFVPMCNGRGKQIIFGMAEELLRLSAKHSYNTIPDDWKNGEPEKPTNVRYTQRFSPQIFAMELTRWVVENGVDLLFDCIFSSPVMDGTHCKGIITESKSGREYIESDIVIDATGDADVLFRAGVPTVQGKNYYTYYAFGVTLENARKALNNNSIHDLYKWYVPGSVNLYGDKQPADVPLFLGTNVDDVSRYIIHFQKKMLDLIGNEDPNTRDVITLPSMPQFRTTRHIDGDYTLKPEDTYRHFDDSIGAICDFDRRDFLYEIPFRTMFKRGFDNLITVGRSVAGEGYAWDVLRVIPPAILTGEVAGIAAAESLNSGKAFEKLDIVSLQKKIAETGILIHFPDSLIPSDLKKSGEKDADFNHI